MQALSVPAPPQKQPPISHSFQIIVSRTASEHDELLRHHVRGNDCWFHCRDYPGAYMFVKSVPGESLPLDTMLDAGNLALFYSKGKSPGRGTCTTPRYDTCAG
jgi:predicted ribosome quality control (RQC) complex YloA/Tae2 family protein